jgi:hypothetical protein
MRTASLVEDAIAIYSGLTVDEAIEIFDFFTGLRRKKTARW